MQASILFIFMLIECKTLYNSRVHSDNFPQHRTTQYAQPEKQTKEPCIIGGESQTTGFYPAIKEKLRRRKEEICNLQNTQKGQH